MSDNTENTDKNEEIPAAVKTDENAVETDENAENPNDEASSNEKKIEDWESKYNNMNDKYLRMYSEFDNFRRRTSKEKIDMIKTAGEDVFKSLLPVVDDLERSLKAMESTEDIAIVKEGVNLVFQKFRSILTHKGLEAINATGKPFDADIHEAITNVPAPSEDMKGKVVDEVEKGYMLNGKVIRFSKVVVGN